MRLRTLAAEVFDFSKCISKNNVKPTEGCEHIEISKPFPPASSKRPFDSPNGGHDLPPEKVTAMGPNEVSWKNLAVSFFVDSSFGGLTHAKL